jgi:chorismate dehydratase
VHRKIRVGAVSYLNTKPLVYAFEQGDMANEIELSYNHPSIIAQELLNDTIDVGLVPVAVIPGLKESYIISEYCIGTEGEVASVCIFSDVPMHEIKTVVLDHQSRTSVRLGKILLKEFWKVSPELVDAKEDFREMIKGDTAGLVIGDRALEQRHHSKYIYDLGQAWKQHSGLPFVFAAWISNKVLSKDFMLAFDKANAKGLQHIKEVVNAHPYPLYDLTTYYTKNISYHLTAEKRKGLQLYLEKIKAFEW